MVMMTLLSSVILGFEGMMFDEKMVVYGIRDWMCLIAYGVLSQGLGWMLITHALPRVPASRTGLILLLQPAFAMAWDIIFFEGKTGFIEIMGALLAISAIYMGTAGGNVKGRKSDNQA